MSSLSISFNPFVCPAHTPVPSAVKDTPYSTPMSAVEANLAAIASGARVIDVYRGQRRSWRPLATPEKVEETLSDPLFEGYVRLLEALA